MRYKHLKINPQATLPSMELLNKRIALESNVVQDFHGLLAQTVPALYQNLSNSFSQSLSQLKNFVVSFSSDVRQAQTILDIPYSEFAAMRGYVPEGFVGNAHDYVAVLKASWVHAEAVISKVLNPYNQYLSEILNGADALKATSKPVFLANLDRERDALNTAVGKFFHTGGTITQDKLGKFYRRNLEVVQVRTLARELNGLLRDLEPETVLEVANNTLELLDAVAKVNNASTDLQQISPQAIRALGESTLTVAREVEFHAITRYRINVFSKTFEETLEALEKVTSKSGKTNNIAQEELSISMEGDAWNSLHRLFDRMGNSVQSAMSKNHFNYYNPKDIAAFFEKAAKGEVSFKKGTIASQRRSAYFIDGGKSVPNIAQAILTETKFLQSASNTGANTDAKFLQLIRDVIKELSETEKVFDYARIYERNKNALTTTPVSQFENHTFVTIPGSALIKDWEKQGQKTFQDIPTWEHGKKYAGIELPACTDADLKKLQSAIDVLLNLVFTSDATLEKYVMKWDEYVKSDNYANQFMREDEDPDQEFVDLDNWLFQTPKATYSPYVCTMVKKMAVTLLEATCNWIRESAVIASPSK